MRFVLIALLVVFFGYSLALVLFNNIPAQIDLVFVQAPAMNLGLLIILTLTLGVLIGLLLAVQLFRVIQMRWEIGRLRKELDKLRSQHIQAATAAAAASQKAALVNEQVSPPTS